MSERYRFEYTPGSVYAQVVTLFRKVGPDRGVIIDIGCGYGAIAEPVRELGYDYVGIDFSPDGLASLSERGFETCALDLSDSGKAALRARELLAGRPLAGLTALDIIEHLNEPAPLLSALHDLAEDYSAAPLVVSIPNVTHTDIGIKLLLGRWDVTSTGLLDSTHVSLFSPARLDAEMARAGWREIARDDFILDPSDQHFPEDLVALTSGTPLHDFLLQTREQAGPGARTNQFIRAYLPGAPRDGPSSAAVADPVFLSVLVRTRGQHLVTLEDTLSSLSAQSERDFEVLLLCHNVSEEVFSEICAVVGRVPPWLAAKVRAVRVGGGGRGRPLAVGVEQARGRYVAALDDDDLALAHWVAEFKRLAERRPGAVVRAGCAAQPVAEEPWGASFGYRQVGQTHCPFALHFDLVDHLLENRTPFCSVAVPRSCFSDLGLTFDPTLPVLEDWDVVLRASLWCGVSETPEVTSIYRRWTAEHGSHIDHSDSQWRSARDAVHASLDAQPILLPAGGMSRLVEQARELHQKRLLEIELRTEIGGLHGALHGERAALAEATEARRLALEAHRMSEEAAAAVSLRAAEELAEVRRISAEELDEVRRIAAHELAAARRLAAEESATSAERIAELERSLRQAEAQIPIAAATAHHETKLEIEASTSWRVTKPLRTAAERARQVRDIARRIAALGQPRRG